MGEANSYKIQLIRVHRMDRSRLVQVVMNYQQARRPVDWYIETGTDHEAKVLESVTTATMMMTTKTTTMMMMMMMMMTMMTMTTTIIMMIMIKMVVVVVVGLMVVMVTKTVTVGQEMPAQLHLKVTCQEGLCNNAIKKCIWMLCKTSEISK
jgi:hypothetical protein